MSSEDRVAREAHFSGPGSNLGSYTEFSYLISLISINLRSSSLLFCLLGTRYFRRVVCPSVWVYMMLPHDQIWHAFLVGILEKQCGTLLRMLHQNSSDADWLLGYRNVCEVSLLPFPL